MQTFELLRREKSPARQLQALGSASDAKTEDVPQQARLEPVTGKGDQSNLGEPPEELTAVVLEDKAKQRNALKQHCFRMIAVNAVSPHSHERRVRLRRGELRLEVRPEDAVSREHKNRYVSGDNETKGSCTSALSEDVKRKFHRAREGFKPRRPGWAASRECRVTLETRPGYGVLADY